VAGKLSGVAVGLTAGGFVLFWSGFKNASLQDTLTSFLSGQPPAPTQETPPVIGVSDTSDSTSSSSAAAGVTPANAAYSSPANLQSLWEANGGPPDTAVFAAMVAMAESGGSATVTSSNPDGGTNVGIWQLDTRGVGSGYTVAQLQEPNLNAAITVKATKGGVDWTEWGDPVTDALPGHQYTPG
jgi:hypothetical protein